MNFKSCSILKYTLKKVYTLKNALAHTSVVLRNLDEQL